MTTLDAKEDTSDTDIYMVAARRRRAAAAHLEQEARVAPALQPRRRVARVPLGPRGRQGAGLPARPPRRRGGEAHRLQGERLGVRLVAGLEAPRARGLGRGSRRAAEDGADKDKKKTREADRHRAAAVHARRRGLPARAALAPPRLRRRGEDGVPAHLRPLRRLRARPGRPTARCIAFISNRTRRPRPQREHATSSWSRRARAQIAARADDVARRATRPPASAPTASRSRTSRAATRRTSGTARATSRSSRPRAARREPSRRPSTATSRRRASRPTARRSCSCSRTAATSTWRASPDATAAPSSAWWAASATCAAFDLGRGRDDRGARELGRSSPPRSRASARAASSAVTHVNDEFLKGMTLGTVERFKATSARRHAASTAS